MHRSPCIYFLSWFPCPNLVVAMQDRNKIHIVPVLKDNNIMITWMCMTFYSNANLNNLPRSPASARCLRFAISQGKWWRTSKLE